MEEFIVQTDQVKSILKASNISTNSIFIQQEPFLYKLRKEDKDYKYVSELFLSSWKHLDKPVPTIVSIWKIYCAKDLITRYELYRKDVGNEWIYFSTTSSKCDNFNANLLENRNGVNYKVILLNNVVLGRIYKPLENDFSLTSPPPGYDSVCGDPNIVKNLKDLKHNEIIVYKEEASIPQFLIVYQTKAN
ncbi:933_t:CDS:2 [Dentiscutata heterogama]|uniref:933_t:CDS:1 n=1 Tax=Dentiscutata heterogama TaxID=1316150 RepID=A0ACA9KW90_9GLOM|nr:933_t:CDS:2 [Dentiscutata heterogama]